MKRPPAWVALAAPGTLIPAYLLGHPEVQGTHLRAWIPLDSMIQAGLVEMPLGAEMPYGKMVEFRRVDRVAGGEKIVYWEVTG